MTKLDLCTESTKVPDIVLDSLVLNHSTFNILSVLRPPYFQIIFFPTASLIYFPGKRNPQQKLY